jgi:hypothetical protein
LSKVIHYFYHGKNSQKIGPPFEILENQPIKNNHTKCENLPNLVTLLQDASNGFQLTNDADPFQAKGFLWTPSKGPMAGGLASETT